jgi:hypothetical protein
MTHEDFQKIIWDDLFIFLVDDFTYESIDKQLIISRRESSYQKIPIYQSYNRFSNQDVRSPKKSQYNLKFPSDFGSR